MAFSTSQMPKNLVKSQVKDEFLTWVMWKKPYSNFQSHSIHIVKNCNNPDLSHYFEKIVKSL